VAVQEELVTCRVGRRLPAPEDLRALRVQQALGDELVDGAAGFERRVQLNDRIGPQQPLGELAIDVVGDLLIADDDEAARVVRVVPDEALPKIEDVQLVLLQPISGLSVGSRSSATR
jgi:hypothetical protein